MSNTARNTTQDAYEFTLSHTLNASRIAVWSAWTEQKQLDQWFGPKGCPIIKSELDFREGGSFLYGMKTPSGDMWGRWTFLDIEEPSKLIFIVSFSEPTGKTMTRHPFSASWPMETLSTVTFTEKGEQTEITLHWSAHNASELENTTFKDAEAGMKQGWGGTFEQLEAYLA